MGLPVRLEEDGAAAPPRENGELAFSAPWESRLFGLTMALVETGRLDWESFRGRLIERIHAWERENGEAPWDYWRRWSEALEAALAAEELVSGPEIDARACRLAARPHGHDHGHGHRHGHSDERRHEDAHPARP